MTGNLADDRRASLREALEILAAVLHKSTHTGVGETNRVEHARADLGHAGLGVARPRHGRGALGGDRTQGGDVHEVLELIARTKRAGGGVDGVLHLDAGKIDGHVHAAHQITSAASKTGPSMQAPLRPMMVSQRHVVHTPKPQAMSFSMETWHATP